MMHVASKDDPGARQVNRPRLRRAEELALALLPAVITFPIWRDGAASVEWNDFGMFYRATCDGPGLYATTPFTNLNPPHFHLTVGVLCPLPIATAYSVWLVFSALGIAMCVHLAERARGRPWPWWAVTFASLSVITASLILTGQIAGILAAPLALAWWADRRGDAKAAGFWFGLVASVKPFVGTIALWWLWRGDWKALGWAVLSGAGWLALGIAVYGAGTFAQWLSNLRAVSWVGAPLNASIWSPWAQLFTESLVTKPWSVRPDVAWWGTAASIALIAALTARAVRTADRDRAWALCIAAALLCSPLGWAYYGWWLLPLLTVVDLPRATWVVAGMSLIPPWFLSSGTGLIPVLVIGAAHTWGLVAVWIGLLARHPAADSRARGVERKSLS